MFLCEGFGEFLDRAIFCAEAVGVCYLGGGVEVRDGGVVGAEERAGAFGGGEGHVCHGGGGTVVKRRVRRSNEWKYGGLRLSSYAHRRQFEDLRRGKRVTEVTAR